MGHGAGHLLPLTKVSTAVGIVISAVGAVVLQMLGLEAKVSSNDSSVSTVEGVVEFESDAESKADVNPESEFCIEADIGTSVEAESQAKFNADEALVVLNAEAVNAESSVSIEVVVAEPESEEVSANSTISSASDWSITSRLFACTVTISSFGFIAEAHEAESTGLIEGVTSTVEVPVVAESEGCTVAKST